ncbi:putative protein of unknown function (DUF 659) [Lyophyllum shimeji]|uniref:HAT C-terminal dimerisation domain-containing protein n=1 Tax=Lyophyllum shimeji TaxID=47721 RepID=A0A9P3UN24_LYOSH|nr:putative protein of unknown function (DUF 659) [Lyophyllum shimeji]
MMSRFPRLIILLFWAHQINLVVGDFLTLKYDLLLVIANCLEVIKWFNNHSTALALLGEEMKFTYEGKVWALILPVITHWTAHYLSTTRLLKVKSAVISCVHRHEEKLLIAGGKMQEVQERACQIMNIVRDNGFWQSLAKIQAILEPLAIAANSSLEKQWEKADQDVFILAILFNPYIHSRLFKPAALSEARLYNIVESAFKRFYQRDGDVALLRAFNDYIKETAEFSWEAMSLDRIREMYREEKQPLDVVFVWTFIDKQAANEPPIGRNALVKLAIRVLTPVPNTAGCEQVFSLFGAVHTKYRNKLKPDHVHKISVVKMDIRRNHIAQGLTPNRQKRKFGEMESTSTDTADPSPAVHPANFLPLATSLIQEAAADDEEPDLPPILAPDASPASSSASSFQPAPPPRDYNAKIPLAQLFNYDMEGAPSRNGAGLDFYWHGGIKNMQDEIEQCDLEATAEDSSDSTASENLTTQ